MHTRAEEKKFVDMSQEENFFSRLGKAFSMVLFVNPAGMVEKWLAPSRRYESLLSPLGKSFSLESLPLEDPLLGKRLLHSLRKEEEASFFCSFPRGKEQLHAQGWIYCFPSGLRVIAFQDRTRQNGLARKTHFLSQRIRNILMAVQSASMGFWEWDLESGIFSVSRRWRDVMGFSMESGKKKWLLPLSPEEREKTLAEMLPFFPEEAPAFEGEYQIEHPWKGSVWVNAWGTVVRRKSSGKPLKIMGCHQDISLRKRALEDLEAQKIKFECLFSENTTAICVMDHAGKILQVNRSFESLFGFSEKELRNKQLLTSLVPLELREDFRSYYEEVTAGNHMSRETWRRKKDGSLVEVWLRSIPVTMSSRRMSYDMYLDITLRKRAIENLRRMATTDMLTAIFNRQHFNVLAREVLQEAREKEEPLSLILFDIDDFKSVNDTCGHLVGDMVLQKIARGVWNFLGKEALFARWGGEEFVLLVSYEGGKAKALAERLRNIVAAEDYSPVPVVTASFGVAEFREYHQGLGSLEQEADLALYRAKISGKNRVVLYGPDFGKE